MKKVTRNAKPVFNIDEAQKEYKQLLVSKENNERLRELKSIIDYFNYGIT